MFKRPVVIASNNLDKTGELVLSLKASRIPAESYRAVHKRVQFPKEGTHSYFENARQKALFMAHLLPDDYVLADDTGMMVAAYPDKFGVQTARQLKTYPTDEAKNLYLIKLVAGKSRLVTFRTELVLCTPNHHLYHSVGIFKGTFSTEERGQNGFGFDKILVPLGDTQTLAEKTTAQKLPFLHRTKAVHHLLEKVVKNDYEYF